MTDLIERLRTLATSSLVGDNAMREAAALIETQAAQLDEANFSLVNLGKFNRDMRDKNNSQAAEIAALEAKLQVAETALKEMVYETTSLSPMKINGDHDCTIRAETLRAARAALYTFPETSHDYIHR